MSLGQIEDSLGLGGHGWVQVAREKGSSLLDCNQFILEMNLFSWVWRLESDDLADGSAPFRVQLSFLLLREVEPLEQFLCLDLHLQEEGFSHEKGKYQLLCRSMIFLMSCWSLMAVVQGKLLLMMGIMLGLLWCGSMDVSGMFKHKGKL